MNAGDKRRRNARPSKYRPRTEAQKEQRRTLWAARRSEQVAKRRGSEEHTLKRRLEELETALRDTGHDGVHRRRNSTPLQEIIDDEKRLLVLKARVERLQALWSVNKRKRETRGKIIIGGAMLAEAGEAQLAGDFELLAQLVDILDRRVERPLDRLTLREILGDVPLPMHPNGGDGENSSALKTKNGLIELPDFDPLVEIALCDPKVGLRQPS